MSESSKAVADTAAVEQTRQQSEQRLQFIEAVLADQKTRTAWWNGGFAIGGGLWAASQFTAAYRTESYGQAGKPNLRAFYLVGAIRGSLGVLKSSISPLRVASIPEQVTALCQRLAMAEAALKTTAQHQSKMQRPFYHFLTGGVGVASTLLLGLVFDEWKLGLISGGTFITAAQFKYWTQPVGAVQAWRQYQQGRIPSPGLLEAAAFSRAGSQAGLGVVGLRRVRFSVSF